MTAKTEELVRKHCVPCEGGIPPCTREEALNYLKKLSGWSLSEDGKVIRKEIRFKNFKEVIVFFNRIAGVAEEENHHPDLRISYSRIGVELSTHAIKGLSENDFIVAAKIDALKMQ